MALESRLLRSWCKRLASPKIEDLVTGLDAQLSTPATRAEVWMA